MAIARTSSGSNENRIPVGAHGTLDDLDTAVTLTIPAGATHVWLQVEEQNIRFTVDGTDPDASATPPVGFVIAAGTERELPAWTGVTIKLIEEAAGAIVQYQGVK